MEQDRKEKDPVPAKVKVWDVAVREKGKVAVKSEAGAKAKVAGRDKAKVRPRKPGKAVNKINKLPLEKGVDRCQVEIKQGLWERAQ